VVRSRKPEYAKLAGTASVRVLVVASALSQLYRSLSPSLSPPPVRRQLSPIGSFRGRKQSALHFPRPVELRTLQRTNGSPRASPRAIDLDARDLFTRAARFFRTFARDRSSALRFLLSSATSGDRRTIRLVVLVVLAAVVDESLSITACLRARHEHERGF
jgi:hypothetical protein